MTPILRAEDLVVRFPVGGGRVLHAVDAVTFEVRPGETLGLVGESGSGKSTLALTLMRVHRPAAGRILVDGRDIAPLSEAELRPVRRRVQIVFQDPYSSLDPRWTVGRILAEPLATHGVGGRAERNERVAALIAQVGLPADAAERLPSQFSGGQRQRIAIARALALGPAALIADEPVSALDVSIQAQIVNLLRDLQEELGVAMLVIAHDLALVHQMSARIAVMYLGEIVEEGSADAVIAEPRHPYTVALVSATPVAVPGAASRRVLLAGDPPSPIARPAGCRFHPRCPTVQARCKVDKPALQQDETGRRTACWYPGSLKFR